MTRPSNPLDFEPATRRRGSREEVQVGAYARQQRRRRILIGALGALLVAGALVLYCQLRPQSGTQRGDRYPVRVRCDSCGYTATVYVPFVQTFPMGCPACKQMACRQLWRCQECGAEFAPEQTGTMVRCPKCNSERVGSAVAP